MSGLLYYLHPEVYYISFLTSLYAEITYKNLEYFTYPAYGGGRGIVKISKNTSLSAGNNKKFGTSETICDESLKYLSIHVPKHLKPLNSNQFGYYLAGLIDGNGHFNNNQLILTFNALDAALAYYLKKQIGFGNVYKVKNAVILVVANKIGILKIINLINGKTRNPSKLNQINNLIKNYKFSINHSTTGEGIFILDTSTNLKNY
jgi:hypothetical protein